MAESKPNLSEQLRASLEEMEPSIDILSPVLQRAVTVNRMLREQEATQTEDRE